MTLYEMTPAGPRPLSLAEAADRVYRALCAARPGSHTLTRLIGLRDLADELAIDEALREREARRERARDSVSDRIRELLEDRRPVVAADPSDPFGHRRPRTLDRRTAR